MSTIEELEERLRRAEAQTIQFSEEEKREISIRARLEKERVRVTEERAAARKLVIERVSDEARQKWGQRFRCLDLEATTPGLGAWLFVPDKDAATAFRRMSAASDKVSDEDARNNIVRYLHAIVVQKSEDGSCEVLRGEQAKMAAQAAFIEYPFVDVECQVAIVELEGVSAKTATGKSRGA